MGLLTRAQELLDGLAERRRAPRLAELERRIEAEPGYSYTSDYIKDNVETWKRLLGHWVDHPIKLLEVGCYEGRSTVWFLENLLTHPAAEITCLDIFSEPAYALRFDHNIRVSGKAPKVKKLKGRSGDLLPGLAPSSYEAIYIDGSHAAGDVLLDATLCWKLLKPAGILLFDDYLWDPEKPISERPTLGIDLFFELMKGEFELLHQAYQVAIRKPDPA